MLQQTGFPMTSLVQQGKMSLERGKEGSRLTGDNQTLPSNGHSQQQQQQQKQSLQPHQVPKNLTSITSWNSFEHSYEDMRSYVIDIFKDLKLLETFSIHQSKMDHLLMRLQMLYQLNPYHNYRHCLDVTQFIYACLRSQDLMEFFSDLDRFIMLCVGLFHDIGHCATNNQYLVDETHHLAKKYDDESPLENFHCYMALALMENPENNIIEHLSEEQTKYYTEHVVHTILATDMKHHFAIKKATDEAIKEGFDKKNPQHKILAMKCLMKAADVSNVVRDFGIARLWSHRVLEEFTSQGDMEKEAGRKVSMPLFDREKIDLPGSQIGFIKFIARGQFETLCSAFPKIKPIIMTSLDKNQESWTSLSGPNKDEEIKEFERNLSLLGQPMPKPVQKLQNSEDWKRKISAPVTPESVEKYDCETSVIQKALAKKGGRGLTVSKPPTRIQTQKSKRSPDSPSPSKSVESSVEELIDPSEKKRKQDEKKEQEEQAKQAPKQEPNSFLSMIVSIFNQMFGWLF